MYMLSKIMKTEYSITLGSDKNGVVPYECKTKWRGDITCHLGWKNKYYFSVPINAYILDHVCNGPADVTNYKQSAVQSLFFRYQHNSWVIKQTDAVLIFETCMSINLLAELVIRDLYICDQIMNNCHLQHVLQEYSHPYDNRLWIKISYWFLLGLAFDMIW